MGVIIWGKGCKINSCKFGDGLDCELNVCRIFIIKVLIWEFVFDFVIVELGGNVIYWGTLCDRW